MKVTDVKMETYRWKRHKPIRNGRYVYPTSGLNVVKIETDEGITGVGRWSPGPEDGRLARILWRSG